MKAEQDTDLSGTFRHRGGEFLDGARSAGHLRVTLEDQERALEVPVYAPRGRLFSKSTIV